SLPEQREQEAPHLRRDRDDDGRSAELVELGEVHHRAAVLRARRARHAHEGLIAVDEHGDGVAQVAAHEERLGAAEARELARRDRGRRRRLQGLASWCLAGESLHDLIAQPLSLLAERGSDGRAEALRSCREQPPRESPVPGPHRGHRSDHSFRAQARDVLVEPAQRDMRRFVDDRAAPHGHGRQRERLRRDVDVLRPAAVVAEHLSHALRRRRGAVAPEVQLEVRAIRLGLPAGARGAIREVRHLERQALSVVLHDVLVLVYADDDLTPEVPPAARHADLERRVDAPPDGRRELAEEALAALYAERVERLCDELHLERVPLVHDARAEVILHEAPEGPDLLWLNVEQDLAYDGERLKKPLHRSSPSSAPGSSAGTQVWPVTRPSSVVSSTKAHTNGAPLCSLTRSQSASSW